jgi:PPM family protein phosphatase
VGEQVRLKIITPMEARDHPRRNRLTQALSPRRATIKPHICQVPFVKDDTLVLCSDGLWGVIPETLLHSVVNDLPPEEAVKKLVQLAIDSGGPDNITVILARHAEAHTIPLLKESADILG